MFSVDPSKIESSCLVTEDVIKPINEDTLIMKKLIGKPLTRIEVTISGVYLEFDPYGSLNINTLVDIRAKTAIIDNRSIA